jgi:Carboxypeptidase regulatory-like domain
MNHKSFAFGCLLLAALLAPLVSRTAQKENRAMINGKITDRATSAPLAAEVGLAIRTAKGIVLKHTRASEQGEFEFADLPAGEFHLSTKHDDYAVERTGFVLLANEGHTLDLRLVKARRVSGVVMDARQKPLAEARVQIFYEQEAGIANRYQWEEGDVRTDAEGHFTIEVHPERTFVVQASSRGFLSAATTPQNATNEIALTLTRGVAVSGTITDEFGNPLADAQVQLVAEREIALLNNFLPFEMLQQAHQTIVTKAGGTFQFENVSQTEHALIVRHPQAESQRLVADVTSKNEFAVTLNRVYSPVRNDRRQQ